MKRTVITAVLVAGSIGLTGVLFGTLHTDLSGDVVLDSYVRFGKGVLLAIGLVYWSCLPQVERRGERISLITFVLVLGTLSRLFAAVGHGVPTLGIIANLIAGLILVPLVWLWQRRVAAQAQRSAVT